MSLRADRVLSQARRYAQHRLACVAAGGDQNASAAAFDAYTAQFDRPMRDRMTTVYLTSLAGVLVEDRRSRGKQLW